MILIKNTFIIVCLSGILVCHDFNAFAQADEEETFKQIEQDDQTAIDAIAMYPTQTRVDILEAAKFPEVIARLNTMQKNTKEKFTELLAPYSKEDQEKIWDMTRYSSLIPEIASDAPKSEAEINAILLKYPEEIRSSALEEGLKNFNLLHTIAQKSKLHDANFEKLMNNYPPVTVNAFRNLINQPEILNTLADNMQMTVVVGDLYKTDPKWVLYKTDSMNQALNQQNTQAAADWQKSLNDNPQALQEYKEATQQYAQENNVQPTDYSTPYITDVSTYPTYPYNWWYGYPTWYPYAYWNPYPYWYDWGFYYGMGGSMIFLGMPSAHFMNWYFYHPGNWSRYPTFGNHCYSFYDNYHGYRYSNNVSRSVNEWRGRNRDVVNGDWDRDKTGRTQRFKEFGNMEMNRNKYNASNPQRPMERSEFISKNQNRYPSIKVSPTASNERSRSGMQAPYTKPRANVPASLHQDNSHSNSPQQRNTSQPAENQQRTRNNQQSGGNTQSPSQSQHSNTNQSRNAQQFHQSTWQQVQPQSQTHYSQPTSRPTSQPTRAQPTRSSGGGGGGSRGGGRGRR